MTLFEALRVTINFPLPKQALELALTKAVLNAETTYSKDYEKGIDLCAAGLLYVLLTTGDVKEGGYALTMPSEAKIKTAYSFLVNKWGEPDLLAEKEPTITGLSIW